jgi:hypothetical protein
LVIDPEVSFNPLRGLYYVEITPHGGAADHEVVSGSMTTSVNARPAAAVPEPAAWATMLLGMGLLGAVLRRGRPTIGTSSLA